MATKGHHHWILQRISAFILFFLTFFIIFIGKNIYNNKVDKFYEYLANPIILGICIIYFIIASYHGAIGMQVIIEDYVHHRFMKTILIYGIFFVTFASLIFFILSLITSHISLMSG